MRRKKVSTESDVIDAIPELEENEQFVIEDKKTIRKERIKVPEIEPEPAIDAELEFDDEPETPRYSQTSLAAMMNGERDDPLENQFCSVHVRRNPDSMNDRFLVPNGATLTLPTLRNIELSAEQSDIEEIVRREHGGGHYFFQIHFDGRLGTSWKTSLADAPDQVRLAKSEQYAAANPPATQQPQTVSNPFDQFFDTLRKQKEMKELLFGDEQRRLESEIAELRRERALVPPPEVRQSEKLTLLDFANKSGNPALAERIAKSLFPDDEGESSHWIVDLVKTGFEHKEELAGIAQMLLGGLAPPPQLQGIEALLRAAPPNANNEPPLRSSFQRKRVEQPPIEGEPV